MQYSNEKYGQYENFKIYHGSVVDISELSIGKIDVVVALETLEHVGDDNLPRILEIIKDLNPKLFLASFPIEVGFSIWIKNIASASMRYDRHKEYSWNETFWAGLDRLDKLPSHGTTHKGFDYREVIKEISHSMKIRETIKIPFNFLPSSLAASIFVISEPNQ